MGGVLFIAAQSKAWAQVPDPFAGNNTLYPADWSQPFRTSHYDYPLHPVAPKWPSARPAGALSKDTAPAYVAAVKKILEKDLQGLLNDPLHWSPQQAGWYDMPWGGQGATMSNGKIDPSTGREALLGSYTGQILKSISYPVNQRPSVPSFQNHAVVYYNDVAAHQLGKIWKNPLRPDLNRVLAAAASKSRLATSDQRLARELHDNPDIAALRRPDGSLDMERYRQMLGSQGMSPEMFEASVRSDLSSRQVVMGIAGSGFSSAVVADTALNAYFEKREIQLARFSTADYAAKLSPSDADLEQFYKSNENLFQAPEQQFH